MTISRDRTVLKLGRKYCFTKVYVNKNNWFSFNQNIVSNKQLKSEKTEKIPSAVDGLLQMRWWIQ